MTGNLAVPGEHGRIHPEAPFEIMLVQCSCAYLGWSYAKHVDFDVWG
jgi:hypothetical protein